MALAKAQKLLAKGRTGEAEAVLQRGCPPSSSKDPRCQLVMARIHEAAGARERALEELRELQKRLPGYAPAWLFYGIVAGDAGLLEDSQSAFAETLRLQPDNELAHSYRALALLKLGRDGEALDIFRKDGFSDNRWFLVRLTEWMESQWLEKERFFFSRPVEGLEEPRQAPGAVASFLRQRRAQKRFLAKDYRGVLEQLAPLARKTPPDPGVIFACALASEMLFDYPRALDYIGLMATEDDLPDPLAAARARNRVRLGQFSQAADDLNKVLIAGPEDFGVNYCLGVLCLKYGERDKARQMFFRAYSDYLVDTLEYQYWQLQTALLGEAR